MITLCSKDCSSTALLRLARLVALAVLQTQYQLLELYKLESRGFWLLELTQTGLEQPLHMQVCPCLLRACKACPFKNLQGICPHPKSLQRHLLTLKEHQWRKHIETCPFTLTPQKKDWLKQGWHRIYASLMAALQRPRPALAVMTPTCHRLP